MHRVAKRYFRQAPSMFEEEPVVVEDTLPIEDCEIWLSHILTRSKNEPVQVQRKNKWNNLKLTDATDLVLKESSHADPIFVRSAKSSCSMDQLPLYDVIEDLFDNEQTQQYEDTLNWFSSFARHAHIHDTLVVAGEGATSSTIQCHPFTKTTLCIDGSQLWRILPPISQTNNPLLKHSATPIFTRAWEGFPFSIGYQTASQHNLFAFRHQSVKTGRNFDEEDDGEDDDELEEAECKYDNFQEWAEDPNMLLPNIHTPLDSDGYPWHSTVTLPGDLLVIPPGWWYQSYNLEPSVSIQSQRCGGSEMGQSFVRHILKTSGIEGMFQLQKEDYHTPEEAKAIIDTLFELLQEHYQGVDVDSVY